MSIQTGSGKVSDEIIEEIIENIGDYEYMDRYDVEDVFEYLISNEDNFDKDYETVFEDFYIDQAEIEDLNLDSIDEGELYEIFSKPSETRKRIIGAPFEGALNIVAESNCYMKGKVSYTRWVPDGVDCIAKCYAQYLKLDDKPELAKQVIEKGEKLKSKGVSSHMFNKEVLEPLKIKKIPLKRIWYDKNLEQVKSVSCDKLPSTWCFVGLIHVGKGLYHAILFYSNDKTSKLSPSKCKLIKDEARLIITRQKDFPAKRTSRYFPKPSPKEPKRFVVVYDVETFVVQREHRGKMINVLIPITLGYAIVDLKENKILYEDYINNTEHNKGSEEENWSFLYTEMLSGIKVWFELRYKDEVEKVQVFAHNGAKFDNLFLRLIESVKIKKCIKKGMNYKMIDLTYDGFDFSFKDTLPFTLASLDKACKIFDTEIKKAKFDIVDKSVEFFRNSIEHFEYLKYDVRSLAHLFMNVEKSFSRLGLSMTCFLGLAGMSYYMFRRQCYCAKNIRIETHPVLQQFIKDSIYGGRVLQWETEIKEELISLDANSLYPSAMFMGLFPAGESHQFKEDKLPDFTDLDGMKTYMKNNRIRHMICEYVIEIPNIKRAIHPYKMNVKNSKGETISNALIYPSNQIIQGVYNEVDLEQMLLDGYKVKKIIRGIYWIRTQKVFKNLIEQLYEVRKHYKELLARGEEEGKLEYVYKIILNSMYGKFNERIDSATLYRDYDNKDKDKERGCDRISEQKLPNGQYEVDIKYLNPEFKKPTQIASYILSYSRAIMNEIIRQVGTKSIYYGDTDSIYITRRRWNQLMKGDDKTCKSFQSKLHNDLCGFKNDYGDDVYITKGWFLDLKRYCFMKKNVKTGEESFTLKFNGMNFRGIAGIYSNLEIFKEGSNLYKMDQLISKDEKEDVLKLLDESGKETVKLDKAKTFLEIFKQMVKNEFCSDDCKREGFKEGVKLLFRTLEKTRNEIRSIERNVVFSISPKKRGSWYIKLGKPVFASLGYDLKQRDRGLCSNPDKWIDIQKRCAETKAIEDHMILGKKESFIMRSTTPVIYPCDVDKTYKLALNPIQMGKHRDRVEFFSSNFFIINNTEQTVVYRDEMTKDFFFINAFGITSKVPERTVNSWKKPEHMVHKVYTDLTEEDLELFEEDSEDEDEFVKEMKLMDFEEEQDEKSTTLRINEFDHRIIRPLAVIKCNQDDLNEVRLEYGNNIIDERSYKTTLHKINSYFKGKNHDECNTKQEELTVEFDGCRATYKSYKDL